MKTLLVIEDDQVIRAYTSRLLKKEGYDVLTAQDGLEGIQTAINKSPDLILSDVIMPKLSGYSVLDTLKHNKSTASIPFIFLSSKSEQRDVRYGIQIGADSYITKPIDPDEFLSTVRARLSSLDQFPENELLKTLSAQPSYQRAGWIYNHIRPQLAKGFENWYVAIEPESGRCFLGRNVREAHRFAQRDLPGRVFYYRHLDPELNPPNLFGWKLSYA